MSLNIKLALIAGVCLIALSMGLLALRHGPKFYNALVSNKPKTGHVEHVSQKGSDSLQVKQSYDISVVKVVQPHELDVILSNKKRYLVRLAKLTGSPESCRTQVVDLLNENRRQGKKATLVPTFFDPVDRQWVVEVYYNESGESLSDWLLKNNFAYHY